MSTPQDYTMLLAMLDIQIFFSYIMLVYNLKSFEVNETQQYYILQHLQPKIVISTGITSNIRDKC
jgi:hypothetical protein